MRKIIPMAIITHVNMKRVIIAGFEKSLSLRVASKIMTRKKATSIMQRIAS